MLDGLVSGFNSFWEGVLTCVFYIIDFCFGWIYLPPMPSDVVANIDKFLDLIFSSLNILGFFVRMSSIKIFLGLTLSVWGFKYVYKIVIWIVKKLPFLGID